MLLKKKKKLWKGLLPLEENTDSLYSFMEKKQEAFARPDGHGFIPCTIYLLRISPAIETPIREHLS